MAPDDRHLANVNSQEHAQEKDRHREAYGKEWSNLMPLEMQEIEAGLSRCISSEKVVFFVVTDSHRPPVAEGCPANGGTRIKDYPSETAAIREAYALAERMTHKHALYNTGFAGAKIVVWGAPDELDRHALLDAIAEALHTLAGEVYTGTDFNTSDADMDYLDRQCRYVLAGIGSEVVPGEATAAGVVGAISATVGRDHVRHHRFLVHGLGKVGLNVAERLNALGADVFAYDIALERARRPGFRDVSDDPAWWRHPFDILVPCSDSGIISPDIAEQLSCSHIIGATNKPFTDTVTVVDALVDRAIVWVPDAVSTAGAVISDSVEYYATDVFRQAGPEAVYTFISQCVSRMTRHVLAEYQWGGGMAMNDILVNLIKRPRTEPVCGLTFQADTGA